MPAGDMDSEYTVGVKNRFIGIDSDMNDDPFELIRVAQEKPLKKEKDSKTGKSKKDAKASKGGKDKSVKIEASPTATTAPEPRKNEGSNDRPRGRGQGRGRGAGRGGRGRGRGGFGGGSENREESFGGEAPSGGQRSGGFKGACHKCNEEGHFARECPNVEPTPRNLSCHKCGEEGHFARQCPKSVGACHKCSEVGHFARDCPQNQSNGGGGFEAPSGGGFGGLGSPSSGPEDEDRRGRSGFRGGRGGRGGRGRGGKGREFDRRSGSDKSSSVKPSEKRDGAGSYNWGTPKDELEAASEETQEGFGSPKEQDDYPAQSKETVEGENESSEEDKEVGRQEMSFAEWKNQQEEKRSKPQHNIRKANEGEKIKGVKQLKKPTEEENEEDGSLFFPKKYYEEKLKTSGRVKEHMNLDFQFTSGDNRHLDGERSRRSGRNRGGRGGRKEDSNLNNNTEIQLENTDEFPSLG